MNQKQKNKEQNAHKKYCPQKRYRNASNEITIQYF